MSWMYTYVTWHRRGRPISVCIKVVRLPVLVRQDLSEQRGATRAPVPVLSHAVASGATACPCYRNAASTAVLREAYEPLRGS